MKENWQYKKLGDVCEVVGGSTPKTTIDEYWHGENYWVTPAELIGDKYQGPTKRKISDNAVKSANLQLLPVGTVLLSSRAPIGKVAITTVPMYCNQGFKNLICSKLILNEYVYWFLVNNHDFLNSLGNGATFKEISKRITENIIIPVPTIEEQERIVAELDLLSRIIEKQKKQLNELDTLAQSIFYSMFGDPISNEKNFKKITIDQLCEITSSRRIFANEYCENGVPFYRGKEISELSKGEPISVELYISIERYEELLKSNNIPILNDILITAVGTIGNIWVVNNNSPFYFKDGNIIWLRNIDHKRLNSNYFKHSLSKLIEHIKESLSSGSAYKALTIINLKKMLILLPPIDLQNQFAEKIEKIEKQKEAIKRSIKETQMLFDYTMDKYFG